MLFDFDQRESDSSFVEAVWQTRAERDGNFISLAATQWEMVVTKYEGQTTITIHGPETKATNAEVEAGGEFFGIIFKLGTFMPHLPIFELRDRNDALMPEAGDNSFWLNGASWQIPTFENADTFVDRLIRDGVIAHDRVVDAVLNDRPLDLTERTIRRRFLRATGLPPTTVRQIERARLAATLLEEGSPLLDVAYDVGYFDQAHMTRSLRRYIGRTPAEIANLYENEQMSFLYNKKVER